MRIRSSFAIMGILFHETLCQCFILSNLYKNPRRGVPSFYFGRHESSEPLYPLQSHRAPLKGFFVWVKSITMSLHNYYQ